MALTKAFLGSSENLFSARSLFIMLARFESIMSFREIPSRPVALFGFKGFINQFIFTVPSFGKSNRKMLFYISSAFEKLV